MKTTVKDWITLYRAHPDDANAQLLTFTLQLAGVSFTITAEQLRTTSPDELEDQIHEAAAVSVFLIFFFPF